MHQPQLARVHGRPPVPGGLPNAVRRGPDDAPVVLYRPVRPDADYALRHHHSTTVATCPRLRERGHRRHRLAHAGRGCPAVRRGLRRGPRRHQLRRSRHGTTTLRGRLLPRQRLHLRGRRQDQPAHGSGSVRGPCRIPGTRTSQECTARLRGRRRCDARASDPGRHVRRRRRGGEGRVRHPRGREKARPRSDRRSRITRAQAAAGRTSAARAGRGRSISALSSAARVTTLRAFLQSSRLWPRTAFQASFAALPSGGISE